MTPTLKNGIVLSLYFILLSSSCKDIPTRIETIYVVNNSDHNIESVVPYHQGPFYPDTSLVSIVSGSMQNTPPGRNAYYDHRGRGSIAELLEASPLGLISVYIFHPDTLTAYTDEEIVENYNVLARYDLSLSDLESLDFFVPYPPSEAMDSMQIYIP
jgi:hypothetical protein